MDGGTWLKGVSDGSKKMIEALRDYKLFSGRNSRNFLRDSSSLSVFYEYGLDSGSSSAPTVVTVSEGSSSDAKEVGMFFSSVDEETLLLLQEALLHHYSSPGGGGTLIMWAGSGHRQTDSVRPAAFHSDREVPGDGTEAGPGVNGEEDIFEGVGSIFDRRRGCRTRARSLDRSLTPDLDEFVEDVYDLGGEDLSCGDDQLASLAEPAKERETATQWRGPPGFSSGSRRRRGSLDYSLLSRRGPVRASGESRHGGDPKLPRFEDGSSSSYAECYLEVDGISHYETHHEELEPTRARYGDKETEGSSSAGDEKRRRRNGKCVGREWKSIQKIMNQQSFRSLETFNSLISRKDDGSL